jgi:hypothetical protein
MNIFKAAWRKLFPSKIEPQPDIAELIDQDGYIELFSFSCKVNMIHELEALRIRAGAQDYAILVQQALSVYEVYLDEESRKIAASKSIN